MSHAVVRGAATPAQLYLDGVLDAALQDGGGGGSGDGAAGRGDVNLAQLLYYCLRTNPKAVHSINAETAEKFTNEQILKRAVSVARALRATCTKEKVIFMVRNHEHMSALYYGVLLAGVVPFMMEPGSTQYELQQVLPLVCPRVVFCEPDRVDDVTVAVRGSDVTVVAADGPSLDHFTEGCSDDIDSYSLPDVSAESTALILPTSGSTGAPKAALLNHQGLVAQMPCAWLYHSRFPQPTPLALLASTAQWMTHTIFMTAFPVYQVPLLMTPAKITAKLFVEMAGKYRASWALIGPSLAAAVGHLATNEQLSSFERFYVGGSSFSPETLAPLQEKLPPSSSLLNGYGMTEVHGFVAFGPPGTPLTSVGKVVNILDYKMINECDEDISSTSGKGEMYLGGKSIFKGYLKNEAAYSESVTPDGWLKTGDVFFQDEEGLIFFVNRSKLSFKYWNHHICPEEVEQVIGSVPGVQQCVVCGTDAGPAAAVVPQPGCDVTRDAIHHAVNATLSDYKRLRGGIAFVAALPRTHSGKVHRANCLQLIQELIGKGECF